jgi:fibrillarin-like pre-rRNA processing protein
MIWVYNTLVSPAPEPVYGEMIVQGFRVWDPRRSKLAALYHMNRGIELESHLRVLYLGAAHGTTASHVADYVEVVYAIEPAPRPFRDLLDISEKKKNIIPIKADARKPEIYRPLVEKVDLIYQDIAQPDQVDILLSNAQYLTSEGSFILMLKSRSIEVHTSPHEVAAQAGEQLRKGGFVVDPALFLDPIYPDHAVFIGHSLSHEACK